MQAGDNVQVARADLRTDLDMADWIGIPINMQGKAVRLWAVHYSIAVALGQTGSGLWVNALSSNPSHEGEQAALNLDYFVRSPDLYGTSAWIDRVIVWEPAGVGITRTSTKIIPLYGIIRPVRQIWIVYLVGFVGSDRMICEIYYEPIELAKSDLDSLNRKYGRYRRT
ncbi:hypothetical protein ES705_46749 [subsurface metagenome]